MTYLEIRVFLSQCHHSIVHFRIFVAGLRELMFTQGRKRVYNVGAQGGIDVFRGELAGPWSLLAPAGQVAEDLRWTS